MHAGAGCCHSEKPYSYYQRFVDYFTPQMMTLIIIITIRRISCVELSPLHIHVGWLMVQEDFLSPAAVTFICITVNLPSVSCCFAEELEHSVSNLLSVLLPGGYPPPPPCTPHSKIPLSLAQVIFSSFIPAFPALHPDFSQHICLILLHGTLRLLYSLLAMNMRHLVDNNLTPLPLMAFHHSPRPPSQVCPRCCPSWSPRRSWSSWCRWSPCWPTCRSTQYHQQPQATTDTGTSRRGEQDLDARWVWCTIV